MPRQRWQFGARVVFEPENQISRARNAGARAARGRYFIFVDADTCIEPWLIHEAISLLEQGATCGGGAQVTFDSGAPWSAGVSISVWNWLSRTMGYAAGCFIFCTREAFEGTGGFSETVYASEEIWFSRSVARWGRPRAQKFHILRAGGIKTSTRKLLWHNQWKVLALVTFFTVCPFAVRSRRLCSFWYRRP
jgi:glycosyltransferase involved in cell wall biosynthesis